MNRLAVLIVVLLVTPSLVFGEEGPSAETIRSAIAKAIPPMESAIKGHSSQRDCFSCHHHAMGTIVFKLAQKRGFAVDATDLAEDLDLAETQLKRGAEVLKQGKPIGGGVTTVGYALMTLELGKRPANDTTAAAVTFLIKNIGNGDHWNATSNRVPSEGSSFTATSLAIRALKAYGQSTDKDKIGTVIIKAKAWLLKNPGTENEDRVFRLRGLKLAGAEQSEIESAVAGLIGAQKADGGWAQLDGGMESDAYATGTVLVALAEAGGMSPEHVAFRKGLAYLLKNQKADGTWQVKTRTKVIVQKYFESGFPHGKDQFISIAATGWSTAALLLALPEVKKD